MPLYFVFRDPFNLVLSFYVTILNSLINGNLLAQNLHKSLGKAYHL